MLLRISLLACMATCLSSCGTATHMIGQASGLLSTVAAPVTGILHLSDSPDSPPDKATASSPDASSHDRQRVKAQRQH